MPVDPIWIGDDRKSYSLGDLGFLIEKKSMQRKWSRLELRDHPALTAGTLVPQLLGTVDGGDIKVTAYGVGKIVEVTRNGRGRVKLLTGTDLVDALGQLGYPELVL